jgi:hypothetical protein
MCLKSLLKNNNIIFKNLSELNLNELKNKNYLYSSIY